jgi:hypothetical protein
MDKQAFNPAEWDDVEEKLSTIRNLSVGELLGWGIAGVILIAGVWQAFQPIKRYPEERRSAA